MRRHPHCAFLQEQSRIAIGLQRDRGIHGKPLVLNPSTKTPQPHKCERLQPNTCWRFTRHFSMLKVLRRSAGKMLVRSHVTPGFSNLLGNGNFPPSQVLPTNSPEIPIWEILI